MGELLDRTDEILDVVENAWQANAAAINGDEAKLCFPLRGDDNPGAWPGSWARVTVKDTDAGNYAFGRRYINVGTLFVNIFVPKKRKSAGTVAQKLAEMVRDAIRAHQNGDVVFDRVRPQFVGTDGEWMQYNVLADFEWHEDN